MCGKTLCSGPSQKLKQRQRSAWKMLCRRHFLPQHCHLSLLHNYHQRCRRQHCHLRCCRLSHSRHWHQLCNLQLPRPDPQGGNIFLTPWHTFQLMHGVTLLGRSVLWKWAPFRTLIDTWGTEAVQIVILINIVWFTIHKQCGNPRTCSGPPTERGNKLSPTTGTGSDPDCELRTESQWSFCWGDCRLWHIRENEGEIYVFISHRLPYLHISTHSYSYFIEKNNCIQLFLHVSFKSLVSNYSTLLCFRSPALSFIFLYIPLSISI